MTQKGAIQDFLQNLLTVPQIVSNTLSHVAMVQL